jgi:hypothetical protein
MHAPALHCTPVKPLSAPPHCTHALPLTPQLSVLVPAWHMLLASQQPMQFEASHDAVVPLQESQPQTAVVASATEKRILSVEVFIVSPLRAEGSPAAGRRDQIVA